MEKISIMIIEDEVTTAYTLHAMLKGDNFSIIGVYDTAEYALKKMEQLSKNRNEPDIVLVDIFLKGEMNGIELAKIISKKFKSIIIFLTSTTDKNIFEKALNIRPFSYLIKPCDIRQISLTLKAALYNRKYQFELFEKIKELEKENLYLKNELKKCHMQNNKES